MHPKWLSANDEAVLTVLDVFGFDELATILPLLLKHGVALIKLQTLAGDLLSNPQPTLSMEAVTSFCF